MLAGVGVALAALALRPAAPPPATPPRPVAQATWLVGVEQHLAPSLAHDHGLRVTRTLGSLDAVEVQGPASAREALVADPRTRWVDRNHAFRVAAGHSCAPAGAVVSDADFLRERRLAESLRAGLAPVGSSSQELVVAVVDTGVDREHPALRGALLSGRSFLPDQPWHQDYAGHGTSMATLIAASADADHAEHALTGVAPGVKILPLKVANAKGEAKLADVAEAVAYAADRGAQVILLSLGTVRPAPLLDEALRRAEESGALVVAAAGNRNTNGDCFPAAHPLALSVGSCFPDGTIAPSTAFSPTTDVLFPGVAALVPRGRSELTWVSGTSVAAARAAGVAALVACARPDATPAAWRALLADAHAPLGLLADDVDAQRILGAGPYAPELLGERLAKPRPELSLRVLRSSGSSGWVVVEVKNPTAETLPAATLQCGGTYPTPALAPGEVFTHKRAASWSTRATHTQASWSHDDVEVSRRIELPAPTRGADLALYGLRATPRADGGLVVEVEVESRGLQAGGTVRVRLEEELVGQVEVPTLKLAERASLTLDVPAEAVQRLPAGEVSGVSVELETAKLDDQAPLNNAATLELALTLDPQGAPPVRTLYQQSGELNIVLDTPWRLAPGRSHLPVLVFLPEKGDRSRKTYVRVDELEISVGGRDPEQRRVIFRDVNGEPTQAPEGTQVLDELGLPVVAENGEAYDLRLFGHERVFVPGRYNIIRLPREAIVRLGLKAPNAPGEVNYLEASASWSNRRRFLWIFRRTKHGSNRRVMRVQFPNDPRPQLSKNGHYLDSHVHTIAEWYQGSWLNLLAPRKNWGGPIPMLKESAYAIGLTDSVENVKDRVITSDHNAFYNHSKPVHNSLKHRPPFGPTGSAMGSATERQVMQEIFGETMAEEVAFNAHQKMVGPIKLPLGAHMLTYRAQHITGAWHGGSTFARLVGSPHKKTKLEEVIPRLTKANRAENVGAATFAAHPANDGQGWSAKHLDLAFELDPAKRDDRSVHAELTGFLAKGLQLWNGEFGRHSMPPGTIFWGDLDPWNDDAFRAGNRDWDQEINVGLRQWHEVTAKTLNYELARFPGIRFPRKVFMIAGSDAHGDFNGTEDRLATMVGAQATFDVDGNAYGKCLTYVMPRPGESPLDAMIAGHSVLTDGPLLDFSFDADTRWDPEQQCWDATAVRHTDPDGRIGGGGVFDGSGTALVQRGSGGAKLGFRYQSTREWGPLTRVALYLTSPDQPNAMGQRETGGTLPLPVQTFATVGPNVVHQAALPTPITAPTAISLGGYSRDPGELRTDDRRCLTNAVYAVPYDVDVTVATTETDAAGNGSIPPGALQVRFSFDMSLRPLAYAVEIKALSSEGRSTAAETGPIDELAPVGTWTACATHLDSVYTLTNTRAIPLNLDRFGSDASKVTFVVAFRDLPQDPFGNPLNRIAATFEATGIGTGGGVGPAIERGPEQAPEFLGLTAHLGAKPTVSGDAVETADPFELAAGDEERPPVRDGLEEEPELSTSPLGALEARMAASKPAVEDDELSEAEELAEAKAALEAMGLPTESAGEPVEVGGTPLALDSGAPLEDAPVEGGPSAPVGQPLSGGPSHLGSGFGFELGPTADTDEGHDNRLVRAESEGDASEGTNPAVSGQPLERVETPVAAAGGPVAATGPTQPLGEPEGLVGTPLTPANAEVGTFSDGPRANGGAAGALGGGSAEPEKTSALGCSLGAPQPGHGWPALLLLLALGAVPLVRRWA